MKADIDNSLEMFETTFEKAGIGIAHVNADGRWIHVNKQLCDFLGYSKEEFLSKTFQEITYRDDLENDLAHAAELYTGTVDSFSIEKRYIHKNGEPLWANLTATAIRDENGNIRYFIAIIKDIADQIALKENKKNLRMLLEMSPIAVRVASAQGSKVIFANKAYARLIQADVSVVLGKDPKNYYADQSQYDEILEQIKKKEKIYNKLVKLNINGSTLWTLSSYMSIEFEGEDCVLGWFYNVTEQKEIEAALVHQKDELETIFNTSRDGIAILDLESNFLEFNDSYLNMTGFTREELLGTSCVALTAPEDMESAKEVLKTVLENGFIESYEKTCLVKDNKRLIINMSASLMPDKQRFLISVKDITDMKKYEKQLEYVAHYDPLTGLPNRVLKSDRLHQAILQVNRKGGYLAVVYLDLDGFKEVNDKYGHGVGDQLLVGVSLRMKNALREGDTLARLGGDEFVAIIADMADTTIAIPVMQRLLDAASQPIIIDEKIINVTASIGVSFYPQENENVDGDQLIRQADQAMYLAKQSGKNKYHIFDSEHDKDIRIQHENLERIHQALKENEFELYYQPKVNMKTGEIVGAEALIRWNHPENGLVPPLDFLPLIEEHKLSVDIGEWVINTALKQINEWKKIGFALHVSVNIGALQLLQGDFLERLKLILSAYPVDIASLLEIEILETSALENVAGAAHIVNECRAMGIHFSLDDFGTGYSSLSYLKRIPVATLKIDQSFVRDMLDDADDLAILEGIIGLAGAFKRGVIAEGVETVEQGKYLLKLGCDLAQGYAIARPMPVSQFMRWREKWLSESDIFFNLETL